MLVLLRSVELKDQYGVSHNIRVQTLGTEDTWKTPSLLMVCTDNGGKIVFSQVSHAKFAASFLTTNFVQIHLEIDPSLYENDDQKYQVLMKNDDLRHEIFGDVLSSHLGLAVSPKKEEGSATFTRGFFLGRHDVRIFFFLIEAFLIILHHQLKFNVLEQLKAKMETPNTLKLDGLTVKFCGKNDDPPKPDAHCLPIMVNTCPDDFSTLDYFDVSFNHRSFGFISFQFLLRKQSLKTEHVGRLLIYSKVLTSSMILVNKVKYSHGFAVIPKELTAASGRGSNQVIYFVSQSPAS